MTNQSADNVELGQLPLVEPPAGSWARLRTRAINEGLLAVPVSPGMPRWSFLALAAGAAMLAIIVLGLAVDKTSEPERRFANTPNVPDLALQGLQKQSALYERALALAPRQPIVVAVSLASRDTALRDRIVAIDRMLGVASPEFDANQRALLWSERTMLLRELVGLRYSRPTERFEL